MSRALTISGHSTLAPEVLGARRGWALRWRRRELHVVRGSRGCRIAPAPPWPSPSHLKRCSSRPSRSAWNLTRRCGPEPGGGSDRVPGAGGGREAGIQREGRRGRCGWALPSPSGPTSLDPPRSALPCPGGLGAVPRPVPGSSQVRLPCQLWAPRSQPASCSGAVSAQEVPTGDDNDDDDNNNKWS